MRAPTLRRGIALTLGVAAGVAGLAAPAYADRHHRSGDDHGRMTFSASVLVADDPAVGAPITDPSLVNPWGITFGPTTPLWVSENGSNQSTVYRNRPTVTPGQPLLTVGTQPLPTGTAFNPTTGFALPDKTASLFLFASLSGQISAWRQGLTNAESMITMPGAKFTGLAVSDTSNGPRLFAADSRSKLVQVYDGNWDLVGVLSDPRLPEHLTPYDVAVLDGKVYVSYARNDENDPGPHGAIDVYSLGGRLLHRLTTGAPLDGPWGMAIAPASWGHLHGALLVGNEDGGQINAFDRHSGHFLGALVDAKGKQVAQDGLWGIKFGNGVIGTPDQLVIAIGADDYEHGLIELVSATPRSHT